jgi:hypothetical protein
LILVNLVRTWPIALLGKAAPDLITLGDWQGVSDGALSAYADCVLGIYQNQVVTAFDITGWHRQPNGRVTFEGVQSKRWAHLIAGPNPGPAWSRGQVRPVKYLDTRVLTDSAVEPEAHGAGHRAFISGFSITVEGRHATVAVPPGGTVTIVHQASDSQKEEERS